MTRLIAAATGAVGLLVSGALALTVLGVGTAAGSPASADIPLRLVPVYRSASETCPGLSWTVLAAIGRIESDHGRSEARGVHSGENSAGAGGPMQFLTSTWAQYGVDGNGDGSADRYDPVDAVYGAARYLCANGAGDPSRLRAAIFAYNHSEAYVDDVLQQAAAYESGQVAGVAFGRVGETVVAFAERQLGVPYVWGGTGPAGFDCSGLTQAAYAAAGIAIPRTSEQQWLTLPHLPKGEPLAPGDLVFFNPGEFAHGLPGHVGIYIGNGRMIDAPHAGSAIRIDLVTAFGTYVGASRPA